MANNLALTRTTQQPDASTSKPNQPISQFANKLYNILEDKDTDDLIAWSSDGDSFYVYDQEKLAREVLPRWFKHNKFQSFVRQLNMYGFHKIPQLQQGVLKSESPNEVWNFQHPNFHRGQPELLNAIHRGKPQAVGASSQDGTQSVQDFPSGATAVDVAAVLNGIAQIQQHQRNIAVELKELQDSNQGLWQEALKSRDRHKKNQDTINRIVKFLAGVFGSNAPGASSPGGNDPSSGAVIIPRKRRRITGGDGPGGSGRNVYIEELPPDNDSTDGHIDDLVIPAGNLTSEDSDMTSPLVETVSQPARSSNEASIKAIARRFPTPPIRPVEVQSPVSANTPQFDEEAQTDNLPDPSPGFDTSFPPNWSSLYQSPDQLNRILASLMSNSSSDPSNALNTDQLVYPNQAFGDSQYIPTPNTRPALLGGDNSGDERNLVSSTQNGALHDNTEKLSHAWQSQGSLAKRVDDMQDKVQSLIQGLGLDEDLLNNVGNITTNGIAPPINGMPQDFSNVTSNGFDDPSNPINGWNEADFQSFLDSITQSNEPASEPLGDDWSTTQPPSGASLNEVSSPATPPATAPVESPSPSAKPPVKRSRKRKN